LGHEKKHGCKDKLRISNLGDIRIRGRCRIDMTNRERNDMPRLTVKRIRGNMRAGGRAEVRNRHYGIIVDGSS